MTRDQGLYLNPVKAVTTHLNAIDRLRTFVEVDLPRND